MEVQEKLKDITECSICFELFKEPKILPCVHTFCLNCLQELGTKSKKGEGDQMPCPLCRKQFTIPDSGFSGLQRNFFMERMIEIKNILQPCRSSDTPIPCEVCLEDKDPASGTEVQQAKMYCVECRQKLCQDCCKSHRRYKTTKSHKVITLEYQMISTVDRLETLVPVMCDDHDNKSLDLFCSSCKEVVCALCFLENHKSHDVCDVTQKVGEFRKKIEDKIESLSSLKVGFEMKEQEIEKYSFEFIRNTEIVEGEIYRRRTDLKELVNRHAEKLLEELNLQRNQQLKENKVMREEIEILLVSLDSYIAYCTKIKDSGSSVDICRAMSDLSARADELKELSSSKFLGLEQLRKTTMKVTNLKRFYQAYAENIVRELQEYEVSNQEGDGVISNVELNIRSTISKEVYEDGTTDEEEEDLFFSCDEDCQVPHKTGHLPELEMSFNKATKKPMTNNEESNDKLEEAEKKMAKMHRHLETLTKKMKSEVEWRKELETKLMSLACEKDELIKYEEVLICQLEDLKEQVAFLEELRLRGNKAPKPKVGFIYNGGLVISGEVEILSSKLDDHSVILGIAILDNELFVVDNKKTVQINDPVTLIFKRRWKLNHLAMVRDMKHCATNKCLYFMNETPNNQNTILRVDRNGLLIKYWPVDVAKGQLSITDESNILFTVWNKDQLREYASDGQLVRTIPLTWNYGFSHPWHAIKLTSGHYVVSHGTGKDVLHRVCIINTSGIVLHCFDKAGDGVLINCPIYMEMDQNKNILAVDFMNNRLLILNSNLTLFQAYVWQWPKHSRTQKVVLDKQQGRLFVVRETRVLAYTFSRQ